MKKKIFISYSSKDKEFVDQLVEDLKKHNITTWQDVFEIKVGDSFHDKINEAIENMRGIAIVFSKNSIRSYWVTKELDKALLGKLRGKKVNIFPILIHNVKIPSLLEDIHYADFTKDFEIGFSKLLSLIKRRKSSSPIVSKDQKESAEDRYNRLASECWRAYKRLQWELLLLADIILEAWLIYSEDKEEGDVNLWMPLWKEEIQEVSDFIISKIIADPRSDHEGIEDIRSYPNKLQKEVAKFYFHFDRDLFISESEPYYGSEVLSTIFNKIVPDQFIAAIAKFAVDWTKDIEYHDREIYFKYFIDKYHLELKEERVTKAWNFWSRSEERFKSLVFLERLDLITFRLFFTRGEEITKRKPLLHKGCIEAFYKEKSLIISF